MTKEMPTLAEYKMEDPDNNQVNAPEKTEGVEENITEEVDELAVDVPDIPLPSEVVDEVVDDEFEGAYKFAIVGVGQGGSRLAETFWKLGYRRTKC